MLVRFPYGELRTFRFKTQNITKDTTVSKLKKELVSAYNLYRQGIHCAKNGKDSDVKLDTLNYEDFWLTRSGFPMREDGCLLDWDFKSYRVVEMVFRGRGGTFVPFRADWSPTEMTRNLNEAFESIDRTMQTD